MNHTATSAPLERWLTGARFADLPHPDGSHPAPALSFEFFPPRTEALEQQLWTCIRRLEPLAPRFVSVTYGAGGSTQARTHATVARIVAETTLTPAAHLTCVGASRGEVDDVARGYWDAGVRHIVALRGDMPGGGPYQRHPQGYAYAADLVAGLRRVADFEISVAAYPEVPSDRGQPRVPTSTISGASSTPGRPGRSPSISSKPAPSCASSTAALAAGITAPIVPGIMPVSNFAQAVKFSAMCGASVPAWLGPMFEGLEEDAETRRMVATVVAAEQVRVLQASGIDEFHFYTLNRPDLDLRHRPHPRRPRPQAAAAGAVKHFAAPPRRACKCSPAGRSRCGRVARETRACAQTPPTPPRSFSPSSSVS